MRRSRSWFIFTRMLFPAWLLTGLQCHLQTSVNDIVNEIEKAQNQLAADQTDWKNILTKLQQTLKGQVDETIQGELTTFIDHTAAVAQQQTICTTDLLARRAEAFLFKLRQAVTGGQRTFLVSPMVCQVPATIEIAASPSGHRIIQASGADFTVKDSTGKLMSVAFWSDTLHKAFPIEEARIGRNTNFNLALNLDGDDIVNLVTANKINKILFFWSGTNVDQPQVLVLLHLPKSTELRVNIGDVSLVPRWLGGDRGTDINDDNPFVVEVRGKVFIAPDSQHVFYNLFMHGRESQPDNTEVQGWRSEVQTGTREVKVFPGIKLTIPVFGEGPGIQAYTAPDGWKITSVEPTGETVATANITKHGNQNLFQGNTQVVRTFVVNGGEGGGEAGNQTGVTANFHELTITIQESTNPAHVHE
jgi:hypothetical protein